MGSQAVNRSNINVDYLNTEDSMLQFIEHTSKMQCNSELSNAMDVLFKRFIYIDDVPE